MELDFSHQTIRINVLDVQVKNHKVATDMTLAVVDVATNLFFFITRIYGIDWEGVYGKDF